MTQVAKNIYPRVFFVKSGVGGTVTGTTTETALVTLDLPAGALGPKGFIRLTLNFSHTNNANVKTVRARLGGIAGTAFAGPAVTSNARTHLIVHIYNRTATSQIAGTNNGNNVGYGQSTTGQVTGTVDTTVAQTLVVTGELATSTDTITLESYIYEYHYQE